MPCWSRCLQDCRPKGVSDKLERGERAAAEPASVIGMEFQRPALQSIAPAAVRDVIDEKLQALSRKHFIRQSVGAEGEAKYRFDHHMVRETVYNGLLKRAREQLRRGALEAAGLVGLAAVQAQ